MVDLLFLTNSPQVFLRMLVMMRQGVGGGGVYDFSYFWSTSHPDAS